MSRLCKPLALTVPSEQGYQPVGRRRTGESTSCTSAPGSASDSGREVPLVRNKAENKKTLVVMNLDRRSTTNHLKGQGCSTAVEYTPRDREAMVSNTA